MRRIAALCIAASVVAAGEVGAQMSSEAPPGSPTSQPAQARARWLAGIGYVYERYRDDRAAWKDWHTLSAIARRRFEGGALVVEAIRAERFGRRDGAAAVDAYADLWGGAYGNLRLQVASDAEVLPDLDGSAELFQALSDGWEGSVAARLMRFAEQDVGIASAGIGRYLPGWYLRGRGSIVRSAGTTAGAAAVLARRFLADPDAFVEVGGSLGEEAVTLAAGPTVELRSMGSVVARAQLFPGRHWGLVLGLGYQDAEAVPGRGAVELGVRARW